MYTIKHHQDSNVLEIENSKSNVYGKIYLNAGASLQELTLNGHAIIKDLDPLTYANTYASSILFPFANRIKDGAYTFREGNYQLETNQKEENNALHGLIYNKNFQIIDSKTNEDSATITLEYNETKESIGFPYNYNILLEYIFTLNGLSLNVKVKNTDAKDFPFTIGWHPYFLSANLYNSSLTFDSRKKIVLGDRNITTGLEDIELIDTFKIEDKQLDDCWVLDSKEVLFNTPKYQLFINSTGENNFLQAYTPPKLNTIAIEPTTGVSDSFNNKIGLEILKTNDSYTIGWNLKVKNN